IRDFHVTGVQTCALPISFEIATGNILMGFSGFQNGLFANDSFAINLYSIIERIEYIPMSTNQLNDIMTQVFYRNAIGKHKVLLAGIGIFLLINLLHRDANAFRYLCSHLIINSLIKSKLLIIF